MKQEKRVLGAYAKAVGEKADDAPYGWVEGIANAFEVDRYGDLIRPEAMLAAFDKFLLNPILSFGHGIDGNPTNGTLPAGKVLWLKILAAPMDLGGGMVAPAGSTYFRAAFANTPDAQLVRGLYAEQFMRGFSIHFLPYDDSYEGRDPTPEELQAHPGCRNVITKLEMIEIACAVVPVNAGSLTAGAKSVRNATKRLSVPVLKSTTKGAATMGNTILTKDHIKAVKGAMGAFEDHTKSLKDLAGTLEELSENGDGKEADNVGLSTKATECMKSVGESHQALGEAVAAMHKAISNAPDAEEGDEPEPDEPDDAGGDADESPAANTPEGKALLAAFDKGLR